tara:strand:+ start:967 stop:1221 length:255 start_codon:yes stop_codon:yes gene_type:complete
MGKIEKYGSYVRKVGYLDIRQKIEMPRIKKGLRGGVQEVKGSVEVFVYHAKNRVAGPFKSHKLAIEEAEKLIGRNFRYNKFDKR